MRRENIHKLCANHFIQDWMKLTKMNGKENTRIWVAFDDTMDDDTEPTKQQFCVRFKVTQKKIINKIKLNLGSRNRCRL